MKKTLVLILAIALAFAMTASAYADDVTITTSVDETYLMTIPASTTTLVWGITTAQTFGTVGLTSARLMPNHQVTITLSGNDGLVNTLEEGSIIDYSVMDGGNVFTAGDYTSADANTDLTILVASAEWNAAPAGTYSDIVTFTASITDIN